MNTGSVSDFMTAWTRAMNNRQTMPPLVPCLHISGLLHGMPCTGHGHPDCRAAYWQRIDDEAAETTERARVGLGSLHPKRRIKV